MLVSQGICPSAVGHTAIHPTHNPIEHPHVNYCQAISTTAIVIYCCWHLNAILDLCHNYSTEQY